MTPGAVVIGEALIDVVRWSDGSSSAPVEYVGGSPLNVSVGLARLGRPVRFVTRVGNDERGRRIVDHLAESGVELAPGSMVEAETSTAYASIDAEGVAQYTFSLEWALPSESESAAGTTSAPTSDPILAHTGSIAVTLDPGGAAVVERIRALRANATITYDPNPRPSLISNVVETLERIRTMIALADVVKVADEDLRWLAPGRTDVDIAREWLGLGPAVVIVTRGGAGAVAVSPHHTVDIAAPSVTVADTVGAGDAFMSGLLDALWQLDLLGDDRREALRELDIDGLSTLLQIASTTAALTVAKPGADPPRRDERDRAVESFYGATVPSAPST